MSSKAYANHAVLSEQAIRLLNGMAFQSVADVPLGRDLVGDTAVVRPIAIGATTVSYLIGAYDAADDAHAELVALQDRIRKSFSLDDIRELCFKLTVPYDDLPGESLRNKARELVVWMQHRGRLDDLRAACEEARPQIGWGVSQKPVIFTQKPDVAIVVSLGQLALPNAAAFLDHAGDLDAHLVLMTNVPAYDRTQFLGVGQDWGEITAAFYGTVQKVRIQFPGARRHFFFAMPVALAFAFGCAWGTVLQGDAVYHMDRDREGNSKYVRVVTISRGLRGETA